MMLQDISPRIYHNEYQDRQPGNTDCILIFQKNTVLVRFEAGRLRYPLYQELKEKPHTCYYLFSIDDYPYFLAFYDHAFTLEGYSYEPVNLFRSAHSKYNAFAGITGHHLFNWYLNNQFCGRCGQKMRPDHKERMLFCESCNNMVYPRISPAVIVGVLNGDKILMSKYAGRSYTSFALIAGFTEIGESVERTVEREVMEEVGLKVKNIRYYKSQPWPFSGSLLLGFFCDLNGSDQITLDHNELAEAGWYSADEIDLQDDNLSLTREMIMQFVQHNQ